MQLSEIWIYPVKSLAGIRLEKAKVTQRGLEFDRRWMLVDENGVFISQRKHPELALFHPEIEAGFLRISHADSAKGSVHFSLSQKSESVVTEEVMVWEDSVMAVEVDQQISGWFSEILGFSVRLVYMPEESLRKVDPDYAVTFDDITSFSDGFPFLLIGQASLNDLNSRLENPVPIRRFRPNFVFTGGEAYEEESWREFTIGSIAFYGVKPCGRCVMTTVNPDLGTFEGKEPLYTLSQYRKVGNKVLFGQNVIAKHEGSLSVGDVINQVNKELKFE